MSIAISNTSPLTNLAVIGRLGLVRDQLNQVFVPDAVWGEMLALPHPVGRASLLAAREEGWIGVVTIASPAFAVDLRLSGLDEGESEAIALAVETSASLLLIDEKKGRAVARGLGLRAIGALAIIAAARKNNSIPSASEEILRLRSEAGFFVSSDVENNALRLAGEIP